MKLELTPGYKVAIESDGIEDISVGLEGIFTFKLYSNTTLEDVLESIDERAEYHGIDEQEILDEIEYEGSIYELMSDPLSLISRLYLETLLKKINDKIFLQYQDIIDGEETFYGIINFEGDETDENSVQRLLNLQNQGVVDLTGFALEQTIKRKEWDLDEIFILLVISTYY
jgi:hypothetical protein